jgi:hypothetical protein
LKVDLVAVDVVVTEEVEVAVVLLEADVVPLVVVLVEELRSLS